MRNYENSPSLIGHPLRFRQIHLDFHTSPHISGIGKEFEKKHWQETLTAAESTEIRSLKIFQLKSIWPK